MPHAIVFEAEIYTSFALTLRIFLYNIIDIEETGLELRGILLYAWIGEIG